MQTIDSDNPEQKIPEVLVGQEPQLHKQTKGLMRTFSSLRQRNYRLFFFGQMISQIGTLMQTTALAWLVLVLTHNAFMLGLVGAIQFLPMMAFSLFSGVLTDRLPKRATLLFTQSFALLQAAILWILVVTGTIQIWQILLLTGLLGLTNSLDTTTRQAFVVEMVGSEGLPNAIALNSSLVNMARVLGPGLGGLLIAWLGVAPLFLLNTISFVAVIIGLFMLDQHTLHALPSQPIDAKKLNPFQSLNEGLSYVWHMPTVLLVTGLIGAIALFGVNFNVMLPLYASDVLHAGPIGFGLISSAYGVGALFSALWVAWGNNQPSIRSLLIAAFAFSMLEIAFALSPIHLIAFPLIAAVGFAQIVMTATANTTIQMVTPHYLRGRVISVYLLVYSGGMPLGNLFATGLATLFSTPISLLIGGILCLAAAIIGWLMRKPAEKSLAAFVATRP